MNTLTPSTGAASNPGANLELGDPPSWSVANGYANLRYFVTPEL
jgi:hypothetical protein